LRSSVVFIVKEKVIKSYKGEYASLSAATSPARYS
jgi:hypothetical protein